MIKEHDQQAKMKATPRKLSYVDSDKEALAGSLAKGFSDQFSLKSSGTSDTPRQTRSTIKSQKTPSKNKDLTHLRRLKRLEDQSTTKEKARKERSKSRRKRFEHQETSLESEYEEGLDDACEDLNSPYRRPKPTLFTQRITRFKYHKRAKLPRNIRVYEGNKDSEDHLGEKWLLGQHKWSVLLKGTKDKKDAFTPLTKTPKEILSMESISFPELSPLIGTPKKQSLNKFCDYHGDRGHNTNDCYQLRRQIEEVVASGKLAHLVKDIYRNNRWNGNPGRNGVKVINMIRQEGNRKRSFKERRSGMINELTFLRPQRQHPVKTQKMHDSDDRFSKGNISSPRSNRSSSNFRKGRKKQDDANGVCNNKMSFAIQQHNRKDWNEKPRSRPTSDLMSLEKTWGQENAKEAFTISHEHLDQYVTIVTTLITSCKQLLAGVLWENREQAKRNEKPGTISKTGVAKSYPGSFPQRGLNDLLGIKRI
nr:reverse transcriptase domain-containing protein [Tanacetum cinerariifolium]